MIVLAVGVVHVPELHVVLHSCFHFDIHPLLVQFSDPREHLLLLSLHSPHGQILLQAIDFLL